MFSGKHTEESEEMKLYLHSWVLSQRLLAFYDGKKPEYVWIEVSGFKEELVLKAVPGSEFVASSNHGKFKFWEKSDFKQYDPKSVLSEVKSKITKVEFLGKTFKSWKEFEEFLEDEEVVEEKFRSTVEFPKSVEVAMRLRADQENKNMKQLVVEAMRAYL